MRVFFDRELETAATFWRVYRRDGVTLGFTSHDRSLCFDGLVHRSAPGMVPTAIRMTADFSEESAGVDGALSHDSISEIDLEAGLFDNAAIEIGIVDWNTLAKHSVYWGTMGKVQGGGTGFSAELRSAKYELERDLVPRTSPTCRAQFCGPGCGLPAPKFTHLRSLTDVNVEANKVRFDGLAAERFVDGRIRFLEGPQTGISFGVLGIDSDWLILDRPIDVVLKPGARAELLEGCDHTITTCTSRFDNAINFRGEPFLPGNDLLARYGQPGSS